MMDCVKKKLSNFEKFREINNIIDNIDLFDNYILKNNHISIKNQLFSKDPPPFDLVKKIVYILINKELNENIYYEFSIKNLVIKKIIEKINEYIIVLKEYYLKCKHKKYLENLNEKKLITLFRQILRPYDYSITSYEKYDNGEKYLLYILEKKKSINIKKIHSTIFF
jgi:hypothetical protein